jgi:hypothetical protein
LSGYAKAAEGLSVAWHGVPVRLHLLRTMP